MSKPAEELFSDLTEEIKRVKDWSNAHNYNHSTAVYQIVQRYRNELKALRKLVKNDIEDGVTEYEG